MKIDKLIFFLFLENNKNGFVTRSRPPFFYQSKFGNPEKKKPMTFHYFSHELRTFVIRKKRKSFVLFCFGWVLHARKIRKLLTPRGDKDWEDLSQRVSTGEEREREKTKKMFVVFPREVVVSFMVVAGRLVVS
jgi:hypothetical protein